MRRYIKLEFLEKSNRIHVLQNALSAFLHPENISSYDTLIADLQQLEIDGDLIPKIQMAADASGRQDLARVTELVNSEDGILKRLRSELYKLQNIANTVFVDEVRAELESAGRPDLAAELQQLVEAVLTQRVNPKTGNQEWALVSRSSRGGHHRVLKYFGQTRPSGDKVAKEERRIQFFKHG